MNEALTLGSISFYLLGLLCAILFIVLYRLLRQKAKLLWENQLLQERYREQQSLHEKYQELQNIFHQKEVELASLYKELEQIQHFQAEKVKLLQETEKRLEEKFQSISSHVLKNNSESFLTLAEKTLGKFHQGAQLDLNHRQQNIKQLVEPLQQNLKTLDEKIQQLESRRVGAYEGMKQQIQSLFNSQKDLQNETQNLVKALRKPTVRGRWGEMQLRRVVEISGMVSHCDFMEQKNYTEEDKVLRPDMVINLPGGKIVLVDAKAPLEAFLDASATDNTQEKQQYLQAHVRHVRRHIQTLSQKSYWESVKGTPDFVVLFLPGESFFSLALDMDPGLLEWSAERRVILATPTTMIALLRSVSYGIQQEKLTRSAEEIFMLSNELSKRLGDFGKHMGRIGKGLHTAVDCYNAAVGSYEARVMSTARKIQNLSSVSSETLEKTTLEKTMTVERTPRILQQQTEEESLLENEKE